MKRLDKTLGAGEAGAKGHPVRGCHCYWEGEGKEPSFPIGTEAAWREIEQELSKEALGPLGAGCIGAMPRLIKKLESLGVTVEMVVSQDHNKVSYDFVVVEPEVAKPQLQAQVKPKVKAKVEEPILVTV